MFAGFNLSLMANDMNNLEQYKTTGHNIYVEQKKIVQGTLDKYIKPDGSLSAKMMEEDWFKNIPADVFLSHSHADIDMVIKLAGFLEYNYGVKCFIDSCVWGYGNQLLLEIDKRYCKNPPNSDGEWTYNYDKRNQSTSHVHMLLNGALAKMINSTECLIFVNTPNSIKAQDATDTSKTASPWIYSELLMATEFPHRKLEDYRHNKVLKHEDEKLLYNKAELQVEYNVSIDKLISLCLNDLINVRTDNYLKDATVFLDQLYLNKGMIKCKSGSVK